MERSFSMILGIVVGVIIVGYTQDITTLWVVGVWFIVAPMFRRKSPDNDVSATLAPGVALAMATVVGYALNPSMIDKWSVLYGSAIPGVGLLLYPYAKALVREIFFLGPRYNTRT